METIGSNNRVETDKSEPLKGRWNKLAFKREVARFQNILESIERFAADLNVKGKISTISSQELQDANMEGSKPGWQQYWQKRLIGEMDTLPEYMRAIVIKNIKGEKLGGDTTDYFNYVNKRVAAIRSNLQKKVEMGRLKKKLGEIDRHEDYDETEISGRQTIYFDKDNGLFLKTEAGGKPIGYGDIVADYEWGLKYRPDDNLPDNIWRKIRKTADIIEARKNIEKIFNDQLHYVKDVSKPTTTLSIKNIEKNIENEDFEGVIAERIIYAFFVRFQYNNPELDFKVDTANSFEDTELKYDLKISVVNKNRARGQGQISDRDEAPRVTRRIGVQLTVTPGGKALREKAEKIEVARDKINLSENDEIVKNPVEDILLVSLPLKTYRENFKKWVGSGKPSGGPEAYLTREERKRLIEVVAGDLLQLKPEDIDSLIF